MKENIFINVVIYIYREILNISIKCPGQVSSVSKWSMSSRLGMALKTKLFKEGKNTIYRTDFENTTIIYFFLVFSVCS